MHSSNAAASPWAWVEIVDVFDRVDAAAVRVGKRDFPCTFEDLPHLVAVWAGEHWNARMCGGN